MSMEFSICHNYTIPLSFSMKLIQMSFGRHVRVRDIQRQFFVTNEIFIFSTAALTKQRVEHCINQLKMGFWE